MTPAVKGYALAIVQDPVKKDLLFLGTETGLYASLDGGKAWLHLKKTIPTASVMDLVIHPTEGDLVIATHGRALWVLDDLTPLPRDDGGGARKAAPALHAAARAAVLAAPEDGATGRGRGRLRRDGAAVRRAPDVLAERAGAPAGGRGGAAGGASGPRRPGRRRRRRAGPVAAARLDPRDGRGREARPGLRRPGAPGREPRGVGPRARRVAPLPPRGRRRAASGVGGLGPRGPARASTR